jgi:Protein of unknown function (DUF1638)
MSPQANLPVVVIACKVFQHLLETRLHPGLADGITFLDYGLHRIPRNLNTKIQGLIDDLQQPSLVVLGYGLCGNGMNGVRAGAHTLLIPRADDCIAILLGSYQAYQREFNSNPGTYYLSKGWLESGSNPLSEYQEYLQKYGAEKADWIMDQQYQNYKRLVFVAHNPEELERYRPQAQEVARFCQRWNMSYVEILGSEDYINRLAEAAAALDKAGEDFIIVPPGGELTQGQFIR